MYAWISVTEMLPDDDREVLVFEKHEEMAFIGYYEEVWHVSKTFICIEYFSLISYSYQY